MKKLLKFSYQKTFLILINLCKMVLRNKNYLMDLFIKVILLMEKKKELELYIIVMVINIWVI